MKKSIKRSVNYHGCKANSVNARNNINTQKAVIIVQRYVTMGRTQLQMAEILNKRNIKTRLGGEWTQQKVSWLIKQFKIKTKSKSKSK